MSKAEILELLPKLGTVDRREIFDRLCALDEAETSESDQKLIDEAFRSGPARPATRADWEGALQNGLRRGAKG